MVRQIEIDTDVFAAIWTNREACEDTENDILRRLLLVDTFSIKGDDEPQKHSHVGVNSTERKEVNTSKCIPTNQSLGKDVVMGKIRWVDDIQAAMKELGGRASLCHIYKAVEKRRQEGGRSLPRTIEATIRRTLGDHSSDSAHFRGLDLFALVGRGEWALR